MRGAQRKELERWAEELQRAEGAELRAAGRAIRALCAENDALARRLRDLEPPRAEEHDLARNGGAAGARDVATRTPALRSRPARRQRGTGRRNERVAMLGRSARQVLAAGRARGGVLPPRRIVLVLAAVVAFAAVVVLAARAAAPDVAASGPPDGALIDREELDSLSFSSSELGSEWLLDGRRVRPRREGDRLVFRPAKLADGRHELVIRSGGRILTGERSFRFTVDTAPPLLKLAAPAVLLAGKPLEIRGTLEPGARLLYANKEVPVGDDGTFGLRPPESVRRLVVTAADRAGNRSRWRIPVTVAPRRPAKPVRSVHVTAHAWANDELRRGIMALVRAKKINAVELDLKDESGEVGWASGVPLAKQMGAQGDVYDLPEAIDDLHELGVRVIGRLVCFRDPVHAQAAWRAGRRNEVVQAPGGAAYAGYGGFTNFADPAVRKYNIDLAVAAAKLGVDEILYDYVRRPDGPISSMVFPGLRGTPERAIARFLAESRAALAATGALLGASVFGVAATRPTEVAQDIPAMARHVDYIAPMLYPSHWAPGEYDVPDPNGQPYDIVRRSTGDFVKQVRGTGARIVNWLQDFSYGRAYGPAEVRAQIEASRDAGVPEFILWDAAVTYTAAALEPTAELPAVGLDTEIPKDAPMPVRLPDPEVDTSRSPAPGEAAGANADSGSETVDRPLSGLPPNELGQVPVVMHHMIRPDRVGEYDQTPEEFRAELEYLWKNGYALVNVGELLDGKLDVPEGTTPVAFTFDDATTYQIEFAPDGSVKPTTAVGIMLDFAERRPGFVPKGTFYVNREPFGSRDAGARAMRWLVENGFEIGNHTHDHIPLHDLSDDEARRQIATGATVIRAALPGYEIRSLSLPLGSLPRTPELAVEGSWRGRRYGPYAVLLVGAGPAPSPFSKSFDPTQIPRIRTSHAGWSGERDFGFSYWMSEFERRPAARYVSDGDPTTITVPKGKESEVRPELAPLVTARP